MVILIAVPVFFESVLEGAEDGGVDATMPIDDRVLIKLFVVITVVGKDPPSTIIASVKRVREIEVVVSSSNDRVINVRRIDFNPGDCVRVAGLQLPKVDANKRSFDEIPIIVVWIVGRIN